MIVVLALPHVRVKNMLTRLTGLIVAHNVFVEDGKPSWFQSLGITLLYLGLPFRQAAEVFSFFEDASYEAAQQRFAQRRCAQ